MDPGHTADTRYREDHAWALAALRRWEPFPVDSAPRPLILTAPPIRFEGRFLSGQAKLAFTYGDIRTSVPLPDGLMALLGESEAEPLPAAGKRRWKKPLRITRRILTRQNSPLTVEYVSFPLGA